MLAALARQEVAIKRVVVLAEEQEFGEVVGDGAHRRPPHGHRRSAKHHSICFDVRRETETPDAIPQDKQFDASNFTQV